MKTKLFFKTSFSHYFINFFCIICITLLFPSCERKNKPLDIVEVKRLSIVETMTIDGKNYPSKFQYYIIKDYSDDSLTAQGIRKFISTQLPVDLKKYNQYGMIFYKESAETNIDNINKNPRIIDRYSQNHDMVLYSEWNFGKFFITRKYRNGKTIPSDPSIEVLDVE